MTRHFLTVPDLSPAELGDVLKTAEAYKIGRRKDKPLANKVVALVFQKPSMRTRVAFEVAVVQLGGAATYLGQDDIQLGLREPVKDVARVLSRYVDGIVLRTFGHAIAEEFAAYSRVPVINGLSDLVHPCQALADVLTIQEAFGRLKGVKLAYIGDGNNVLHSLAQACAMAGVHVVAATPKQYGPEPGQWAIAKKLATQTGAKMNWVHDPVEAVRGAQVLYTDVWVSMGQEKEKEERRNAFVGYQISEELLAQADKHCRVMHCLPAHRGEEITEGAMECRQSLVFDQAENRLHVHKAVLTGLLSGARRGSPATAPNKRKR